MTTTDTPTPTLRFVYFDGPDTTYVHDAQVRTFTPEEDAQGWTECYTECGKRFAVGDVVVVTDPDTQGHALSHLPCLLLTASYGQGHLAVYTDEEVADLQRHDHYGDHKPRHARP